MAQLSADEPTALNPMKPARLLMVEDDDAHAALITRNLRRLNLFNQIDRVALIEEAREVFRKREPNGPVLLLLDLNLPDGRGTDLLEWLRADAKYHDLLIIVLTTTDDEAEVKRCYELGCNVYLTKPIDPEAFAGAIKQLGLFLAVVQVPQM